MYIKWNKFVDPEVSNNVKKKVCIQNDTIFALNQVTLQREHFRKCVYTRENNSSAPVYLILFNIKTVELSVAHNSDATQLINVSSILIKYLCLPVITTRMNPPHTLHLKSLQRNQWQQSVFSLWNSHRRHLQLNRFSSNSAFTVLIMSITKVKL